MGAPDPGLEAAEHPTAEALLTAFRTIKPAERAKHEQVLDYWLSIRGDKEFPPLHDLDPLEISDAGPCSILLELISGGQDAEVRHLGEALRDEVTVERIIDAPNPSVLACIAKKLPIVAISRDFLAFEDNYTKTGGSTRCWITLLPLSSCGSWVDYVYAFVSVDTTGGKAVKAPESAKEPAEDAFPAEAEAAAEEPGSVAEEVEVVADSPIEEPEVAEDVVPFVAEEPEASGGAALLELEEPPAAENPISEPVAGLEPEEAIEPEEAVETVEPVLSHEASDEALPAAEREPEFEPEPDSETEQASGPGFSKLLEGIAHLTGFYGQGVKTDSIVPAMELTDAEPPVEEPFEAEPVEPLPNAVEPAIEPLAEQPVEEPPTEEPAERETSQVVAAEIAQQPAPAMEGTLQSKLAVVQAKADEAREAQLRATQALHEGLSAAYDFSLEAESSPEEYLRLVEAQGLKIQLRAPMAPVAKLAFDGVCDTATIRQFEAVLAWALKVELPRGALLERIEQAGGIQELLNEFARAA